MEAPYSFHMEGKWSLCAARVDNLRTIKSNQMQLLKDSSETHVRKLVGKNNNE